MTERVARTGASHRGRRPPRQATEDLVKRAKRFGTETHKRIDQRRKYTGQPYDVHLKAVADLVASVTDDPETLAAAWLHDSVEDTPATFGDIEREFGTDVAALVAEVTDVSRPSDGNRATRKALDRAHLAKASPRGQTVKLADLIDNCRDISRHDPKFARVYLVEKAELLEVLTAGHERLRAKAHETLERCAREIDLRLPGMDTVVEEPRVRAISPANMQAWRLFARVFSTRDIAEPLRSFDDETPCEQVAAHMRALDVDVVGVRRDGQVVGYVRAGDLTDGSACGEGMRLLVEEQTIDQGASLSEVIDVLTRYDHGFVSSLGGVNGMVTREDIQKPVVRMWLFGMITLIEMTIVSRIRELWPNEEWTELIPRARLESGRRLSSERRRRGQRAELLDCLQLADKASILMHDPGEMAAFGFASRKAAKRVIQEAVSLRNNLAHAQDIVTYDWAQIARMTQRVEEIVSGSAADRS